MQAWGQKEQGYTAAEQQGSENLRRTQEMLPKNQPSQAIRWSGMALSVASRFPSVMSSALVLVPLLIASPRSLVARVFDEFQIFDGRITEPGSFDLNQHVNVGRKGRREQDDPRNGTLFTTEIGYATTEWHEVGLYLPVAREFSGGVFGGGFKLRNSFVLPNAGERPIAFGFDLEVRNQSHRFSSSDWATTLRPIIDLRTGPWQFIINANVEVPIGGRAPVVFAPAVRAVLKVADRSWLAFEHYMDVGRLSRWEQPPHQGHQLFVTLDHRLYERVGIHVGLGHGLTHATDRWLGKVILSFDF